MRERANFEHTPPFGVECAISLASVYQILVLARKNPATAQCTRVTRVAEVRLSLVLSSLRQQ